MAEFPALPLWTDAYLGDTTHLTTIEHGAYLLLLMTAWRTRDCALPDDDRLLARYARMNAQQWKRIRPILEPFFAIKGGTWTQGRLTDERDSVQRHRDQQSEKGKAGAAAKALKRKARIQAAGKSGLVCAEAEVQPDASSLTLTLTQEGSVDKSTAQSASDLVRELFKLGVAILTEGGCSEARARSLIGKWRKSPGDGKTMNALMECQAKAITEPVEWLTKRLAGAQYVSESGYEYRGDDEAVMKQAEKRADWDTYYAARGNLNRRSSVSASG